MPLWMASGCRQEKAGAEDLVDGSGQVALQAGDDFPFGQAFGGPALEVFLGGRIPAQAGEHRPEQGGIGLAVSAAVESAAVGLSGGRLDGADSAQGSKGRLTLQSFGVVPGRDE